MTVNDNIIGSIERTLMKSPAIYPYFETVSKTFLASTGQYGWKQEDIFAREPIRRMAICMTTNSAFVGHNRTNPKV